LFEGKGKIIQAKIKSKSLDVSQVFESLFAKRFNACISYQIPIEIILLLFFQNNEIKKKKDWFFGKKNFTLLTAAKIPPNLGYYFRVDREDLRSLYL